MARTPSNRRSARSRFSSRSSTAARRPIVLASRSPQRRAILEQLGVRFDVRPADIEERLSGDPAEVVSDNALRKARSVASQLDADRIVLGVDTAVFLDGDLHGKPRDEREAQAQLEQLTGRAHVVFSGLALVGDGRERVGTAATQVVFRRPDRGLLEWYVASGEWRERAGGYAIQGRGAALVERIEGDYWNVVGLPVALLLEMAPELLH